MIRRLFALMGRSFESAYLEWALREIDPMHPDVPRIVLEIARLKDERKAS